MKLSKYHRKRQDQLWTIYGSGGGKQRRQTNLNTGIASPVEAPNTLQSKTTARIVDVISEGEILGLVDGAKSIYIDETPLQSSTGAFNFSGVTYEERKGVADQDPLLGFPGTETENEVGLQLIYGSPIVRQITDAEADAVLIKIRIDALYSQNLTTGNVGPSQVFIIFEVQNNGGSYVYATLTNSPNPVEINGKTTSPYEVTYRINLPPGGAPWNIRVSRGNAEPGPGQQGKSFWSNYTIIKDVKLKYNNTALVGIKVDSSQFGSNLPARAYEVYGKIISVPVNYNPTTRGYTGIWNGTFKQEYSNNPAWVFYDLVTNSRYGSGERVLPAQIDKYALYAIGVYCDEMVDDGFGGTEPRFTFNAEISTAEKAHSVFNALTSCFRGMAYWASGGVTATMDAPTDATRLVTRSNIIGGRFNYSGTALSARHTVAVVSYRNPDDGYKPDVVVVMDDDGIAQFGWNQVDTVAYGCTSKGQAYRYGKYILDAEKYETETVTYKAGLDHFDVRPGQIIKVQDPHYAGVRFGGRIAAISGTSVTLDDAVVLESGETYEISVTLTDGTLETKAITTGVGTHTTITIASGFSQSVIVGAVWIITASNVEPRLFRVINAREVEKHQVEVTALFFDPTKFARIESNIKLEAPTYSTLPTGPLKPPSDIQTLEYLYQAGAAIKSAITLSWTFSPDARADRYEVQYKESTSTVWQDIGTTSGNSINIEDTNTGDYDFRVRALGGLGSLRSEYVTKSTVVNGLLSPPSDVTNFNMQVVSGNAYLTWTPVSDLDLAYYTVRFSPVTDGSATWGASNPLVPQISKDATGFTAPLLIGTYLIKAVDTSEMESVNASSIVTTVGSIVGLNVIGSLVEQTAWAGTCTDCAIVDGALQLTGNDSVDDWPDIDAILNWDVGNDGITSIGTYDFADYPGGVGYFDLGAVYTSNLTSKVVASGTDLFNNIDLWTNIDAVTDWDGGNSSQWEVKVFVRTTNDNPAGSPTWGAWAPLVVGQYTARAFQFKAVLYSYEEGISPLVTELEVSIDMPDRIISDNDVSCPAPGLTVSYGNAFKALPALNITAQNLATGDWWAITSKTVSGFTINFYNSGGTGISRTFDWIAQGYGEVT